MQNAHRVLFVLGALASCAFSCALLATGCGDDTGAAEGGSDVAIPDGPQETATDSSREAAPDATPDTKMDVQPDNTVADAPPDSPVDVQLDAYVDRAAELAFPAQLSTALCQQIALCCFPDGGTSAFDMSACVQQSAGSGFDNSSYGTFALTNGNVDFDPDAGAACITAVNSIAGSCTVTAAIQQQLLTDCFGAFVGTLGVGAACIGSMECAPGNVCVLPGDGGTNGTCAALRAAGQPCGDLGTTNYSLGSQFCSYRGSGNTGLYCKESDDSGAMLPPGSWTCEPQVPLTAMGQCFFDTDCVSPMVCDLFNTGNCLTTSRPLTTMTACSAFIADAGGGG
jgi:hypothetical protein